MGGNYERELVNRLQDNDIPALRIPASGSGIDKDLPDVLANSSQGLLAIEHKKCGNDKAVIRSHEIAALRRFARDWDASPLCVARFTQDTSHYVQTVTSDDATSDSGLCYIRRGGREDLPTMLEYCEPAEGHADLTTFCDGGGV